MKSSIDATLFLKKLRSAAIITKGNLHLNVIKDDPSDNKYLSCALEGRADFIISGDKHLKDIKVFEGIKIVDPSTFLEMIKSK